MDNNHTPQPLTHDEQKAAEAAFAGRPFNPKWSDSARKIYEGLSRALPAQPLSDVEPSDFAVVEEAREESAESVAETAQPAVDQAAAEDSVSEKLPTKIPLKQAIEMGALIDVTPTAQELGLSFPVTVTKPLWNVGIAPTATTSDEERARRLRDVLMAFRLRLAALPSISPLIDFPALLAFPPTNVPQPIPLFALVQADEQNRAMVTLLLPNEVAATIVPMN